MPLFTHGVNQPPILSFIHSSTRLLLIEVLSLLCNINQSVTEQDTGNARWAQGLVAPLVNPRWTTTGATLHLPDPRLTGSCGQFLDPLVLKCLERRFLHEPLSQQGGGLSCL